MIVDDNILFSQKIKYQGLIICTFLIERYRYKKRQRTQEVIDKIEAGENMAAVAWDYSDPGRTKT